MGLKKSKTKDLKVGDLVTHVLWSREWIGIILDFEKLPEDPAHPRREMALIQIQPGTKYEGFFEKNVSARNKKTANSGYISVNWLYRIGVKK
jgi:hypothetical protein